MKRMKRGIIYLLLLIFFTIACILIFSIYSRSSNKIKKSSNLEKLEYDGELIDDSYVLEDSKITGEDYEIDEEYKIYYTYLTEDEKKLYKQIYANIVNFKTTFIPIVEIDSDKVLKVYQYVTYDNPELFWISNGYTYKYKKNNICKQITLRFNGLQYEYEKNKQSFDDVVNDIVTNAKKIESDYEKEVYVYNRLIKTISYDLDAYYNQTAYSALVNNKTVCAGYSKAFQYIMNLLSIKTYYVVGKAKGEEHAWNIILLNGGYYNVDLTWKELNITDKDFANTHERSSDSEQLPVCTATIYSTIKTKKENKINNNIEEKKNDNSISINKNEKQIKEQPINNFSNKKNIEQKEKSNNQNNEENVEQLNDNNSQVIVEKKKETPQEIKKEENDIFGKVEDVGEDIIIEEYYDEEIDD